MHAACDRPSWPARAHVTGRMCGLSVPRCGRTGLARDPAYGRARDATASTWSSPAGRSSTGPARPAAPGTVVVEGDRLRRARRRTRELPAERRPHDRRHGRVVAPGFIDLHSHGGLIILAEPRHEPKVRQGVTTEIVGVDGNGFAPFERREDLEAFVELDSGLDGRPDIDYDWRTVADYLARYDGTVSVNVGTLVGNSAAADRGRSAGTTCPPTRGPSTGCAALLRDAMAEGAVGLSAPGSTTRPAATPRPRSSPR